MKLDWSNDIDPAPIINHKGGTCVISESRNLFFFNERQTDQIPTIL